MDCVYGYFPLTGEHPGCYAITITRSPILHAFSFKIWFKVNLFLKYRKMVPLHAHTTVEVRGILSRLGECVDEGGYQVQEN